VLRHIYIYAIRRLNVNYSTHSSTKSENLYQTIQRHIPDHRILHGKGKVHSRTGHEGPEGE